MELPYNTVYSRQVLDEGEEAKIADWTQKRAWVRRAFERFQEAGYVGVERLHPRAGIPSAPVSSTATRSGTAPT